MQTLRAGHVPALFYKFAGLDIVRAANILYSREKYGVLLILKRQKRGWCIE